MFKFLIDTCVWLDLARDPHQQALLGVIEELIRLRELEILVPQVVFDEFNRNKSRVVQDATRSLSSVLKRVKDIIDKFGDKRRKAAVLEQLNSVDHKLPQLGEAVIDSVRRISEVLSNANRIDVTDGVKLRAAQRALDGRAPFHRQRNSMVDALIIETYADCVHDESAKGDRFAFITHNVKDFSHPSTDDRMPHPDIVSCFSKVKSRYFTSLAEATRRVRPALVSEMMIEAEWRQEPRTLKEILTAEDELFHKVWYTRHQNLRHQIRIGDIKLVDKESWPIADHKTRPIQRDVWKGALAAARKVEKKYGKKNLGPWDDFEWGMINGKLSALRWVLGDDWDNLDT